MRDNGPVTQVEYRLQDDDVLISKTDTRSVITYANQRFIEVSGYDYAELHGTPHNLVRHPDMPAVIFADMWQDLQGGRFWSGLVKNRRKNGDHYWVRANVVPIRENGVLTGFASIRVKPSAEETAFAEEVYRDIREQGGRYAVRHGRAYRTGLVHVASRLNRNSLTARSAALSLATLALPTGIGLAAWAADPSSPTGQALAAAGLLGGAVLALINLRGSRQLRGSLLQAHDFSLQMAAGNLKADLPRLGQSELGRMLGSLSFMRQSLEALIGDLNRRISVIEPAVAELVRNNEAMGRRLEQQAASVQETAASTEQITATVAQSAEHARQASLVATGNATAVDQAAQVMQALSNDMQEMTQQARNMAGIVNTIDAIAFQTNILALNASVEAARAGVHGRGFAVVAQEVRKLASESADAAHRVQELIRGTNQQIDSGRTRAGEAEQAMARIKEAGHRVNDLMHDLSAASAEQSQGIEQISQAIGEIDQATQTSAASMQGYQTATSALDMEVRALAHSARAFLAAQAAPQAIEPPRQTHGLPSAPPPRAKAPARVEHAAEWETF